jgi:aspartate 1-decarboxylase
MTRKLLRGKIHRATVTGADLHYEGSVTIDEDLMNHADLVRHEAVQVWNVTNGERFETYVIPGHRGSGVVCVNGAAAHKVTRGDLMDDEEARLEAAGRLRGRDESAGRAPGRARRAGRAGTGVRVSEDPVTWWMPSSSKERRELRVALEIPIGTYSARSESPATARSAERNSPWRWSIAFRASCGCGRL